MNDKKIAYLGVGGVQAWHDEFGNEVVPQVNDLIDTDLCVSQWERWIPKGMKKEYIMGDAHTVRLVKDDPHASTYIKVRGFKDPQRKPKKSRG